MIENSTIFNSKKGLTAEKSFFLLFILSFLSFSAYYYGYLNGNYSDPGLISDLSGVNIEIDKIIGNTLYIKNNDELDITLFNIILSDIYCDPDTLPQNYSSKIIGFDLQDCGKNISISRVNVKILTNFGDFEKEVYMS